MPYEAPLWKPKPLPPTEIVEAILSTQRLHPVIARVAARRIASKDEVKTWFNALREPLCDPFAVNDVAVAVKRIREAIQSSQPITIFGDYDTDGITATTLMVQVLTQLGAVVKPFIPDRETEGYGLTPQALERCLQQAPVPALLITVDCGISSVAEVADLNARGIDVIVTDHHVLPEVLPPALAIVNPRIKAPKGAEGMCGCATAFTLLRALLADLGITDAPNYRAYLGLVAVATIADVMSLVGENRSLVAKGLWILADEMRGNPGLAALMLAQKVAPGHWQNQMTVSSKNLGESVNVETVSFGMVPCINAASRIGHCDWAYDLLNVYPSVMKDKVTLAKTETCQRAAQQLIEANKKRREIEQRLRTTIEAQQLQPCGNLVIAAGSREEGFEPGVLGIVAARLSDRYHLPAVVCCVKPDGSASGSMRSRGAWRAVEMLDTIADLCEHYGGHDAAAGFALKSGTFEAFRERLPKAFEASVQTAEVLEYEEDLVDPIDSCFCYDMERLEPFGMDNPRPRFAKHFILRSWSAIGSDKTHLRLSLKDPSEAVSGYYDAVWFGAAHRAQHWTPGQHIRFIFTLSRDKLRPTEWKLSIEDAIPIP